MAYLPGHPEMFTKGTMKTIQEMDMVRCIGVMAVTIRVSGKMAFNMGAEKFTSQVKDSRKVYLRIMSLLSLKSNQTRLLNLIIILIMIVMYLIPRKMPVASKVNKKVMSYLPKLALEAGDIPLRINHDL